MDESSTDDLLMSIIRANQEHSMSDYMLSQARTEANSDAVKKTVPAINRRKRLVLIEEVTHSLDVTSNVQEAAG